MDTSLPSAAEPRRRPRRRRRTFDPVLGQTPGFLFPLRAAASFGPAALALGLLMTALVAGGGGSPAPLAELAVQAAALLVLVLAAFVRRDDLRLGALIRRDWILFVLMAALALAMIVQLVPLPPSLWQALPGRGMIAENATAFAPVPWLPLSIAPTLTLAALLSLLPPYAAYALASATRHEERDWLLPALFVFGAATLVFQLIQLGGNFALYADNPRAFVSGFQANRNAQGDILAILLAALATRPFVGTLGDRAGFTAVQLALAAALVLAVVLTGSRAGMAMCLVLAAVVIGREAWARRARSRRAFVAMMTGGALLLAGGALLLVPNANVAQALSRFGDEDNGRLANIWPDAWYAAQQVMPLGTGFGSFVPAFRIFESQEVVDTTSANRAHNELLELLIEGGPFALGLALIALLAVLFAAFVAFRRGLTPQARSRGAMLGLVSLAMAAHSLVDYPIRSMSIAVLWAVLIGLVVADRADIRAGKPNRAPLDERGRPLKAGPLSWSGRARIAATLALLGLIVTPLVVMSALDRARRPQPAGLSCLLPTPHSCAAQIAAVIAANPKADVTPLTGLLARRHPADAALQALHGSRLIAGGNPAGTIFLHNSARLGWREPLGQLNAFNAALGEGDVPRAVIHFDAMLRSNPQLMAQQGLLDSTLETNAVREEWAGRLAAGAGYYPALLEELSKGADPALDAEAWQRRVDLIALVRASGRNTDIATRDSAVWAAYRLDPARSADLLAALSGQGDWAKGDLSWSVRPAAGRLPEPGLPFLWSAYRGRQNDLRVERPAGGTARFVTAKRLAIAASRIARITVFLSPGSHELVWRVSGAEPGALFPNVTCPGVDQVGFDLIDPTSTDRGRAIITIPQGCREAIVSVSKGQGVLPAGVVLSDLAINNKRLLE